MRRMKRSVSRELLISTLSSCLIMHAKILNLNENNLEETYTYFLNSPFLKDKLMIRKLLFMVNSLMSCKPLRFHVYFEFLKKILPFVNDFFTQDELFSIFELNKTILALLLDNGIITPILLDKNLDFYVDNQNHFFFFFREIEASAPRRYDEFIKANPEFAIFVEKNKSPEILSRHKNYRLSGKNENWIAQLIQNDDIENFRSKVKREQFEQEVFHSIYDVIPYDLYFGEYPTLVEYAALYNAVKIFKFLILEQRILYDPELLLRYAIAGGDQEIINILLDKGCRYDVKCLNTAIEFHQLTLIKTIQKDAKIGFDFYSLSKSIESYNVQILNEIINDENVPLQEPGVEKGWTALQVAAHCGQFEVVRYLIEDLKCDPNAQNSIGNTCLQLACANGFSDIVIYLLNIEGLNINVINDAHGNALHHAVLNDHVDVVKILCRNLTKSAEHLNIGLDITHNKLENENEDFNIQENDILNTFKIDVNALNSNAETPLFIACRHSFLKIVTFFSQIPEVNINSISDSLYTPFLISCKYGNLNIVKILKESNKVDFSAKVKGKTALLTAACYGHLDIVKYLLELPEVDSNYINKAGNNVILVSCRDNRSLDVLKFLIQNHIADPSIKNKEGKTALHIAAQRSAYKIYKYILEEVKSINKDEVDNNNQKACDLIPKSKKSLFEL